MYSSRQREKLINSILYFSSKVKYPSLVKIFKLLYFLDFDHFKKTGRPVTNLKYYAWSYGPVPRDLYFAIRNDENIDDFKSSMRFISQTTSKTEESLIFKPLKEADLKIFSPREKKLMDNLIEIYENETPSTMSDVTHLRNTPWDKTRKEVGEDAEIIYTFAIDDDSSLTLEEGQEAYKEYLEDIENYQSYPF